MLVVTVILRMLKTNYYEKKSTHASILTVQADINYEPKTKAHATVKKTVDCKDVNKTQVYKEKQKNLTKEEIMNAIQTDTEENTSNLILEVRTLF